MAHVFTARFPARCGGCDGQVEVGDTVGYVDDEVCCHDCVIDAGGTDDD